MAWRALGAYKGGGLFKFSTPTGCENFWVSGRGGGGRWVGRSAARVLRGGSVGTPTYIPQNDPHDALITLNIHKWGKKIFRKNLPISSGSHQPRSDRR